jgi:hypothetical protein
VRIELRQLKCAAIHVVGDAHSRRPFSMSLGAMLRQPTPRGNLGERDRDRRLGALGVL